MDYEQLIKTIEDRSARKDLLKNSPACLRAIDMLVEADSVVTDSYVGLIGNESADAKTTHHALRALRARVNDRSTAWVGHIGLGTKAEEVKLAAIEILGDRASQDAAVFLSQIARQTPKPALQHRIIDTLAKHRTEESELAIHRVLDVAKDHVVRLHGRAVLANSRRGEPSLQCVVQQMPLTKRFETLMGLREYFNQTGLVDNLIATTARQFLRPSNLLRLTDTAKKREQLGQMFEAAVKHLPEESRAMSSVKAARDAALAARQFYSAIETLANKPE